MRAIHAGDEGPNPANAIPTEATASVDFRLAPGQSPARIRAATEAYLTSRGWFIVRDTPDMATRLAHPQDPAPELGRGLVGSDQDLPGHPGGDRRWRPRSGGPSAIR